MTEVYCKLIRVQWNIISLFPHNQNTGQFIHEARGFVHTVAMRIEKGPLRQVYMYMYTVYDNALAINSF